MVNDLEHFGIKGMKWGIRRPRASSGRVNSHDYSTVQNLRTKKPRELSNDELKIITKRLTLEADFARLTGDTPLVKSGKAVVGTFIKRYGGEVLGGLALLAAKPTIDFIKKRFQGGI